jgi:hypothetical protein
MAEAGGFVAKPYIITPTGLKFHSDKSLVRAVMGPVGSGKTSMMIMELLNKGKLQHPGPTNVRKTKFLVVRNTAAMLQTTVLETFKKWVNTDIYPITGRLPQCRVKAPLPDGSIIDCVFLFMALDDEKSLSYLPSLEITGAWISEATEITRIETFEEVQARCGRYMADEQPFSWKGMIMEYNPPSKRSFLYRRFEVERPNGWKLFRQPPALIALPDSKDPTAYMFEPNPKAENVKGVGGYSYWLDLVKGNERNKAYIDQKISGFYANRKARKPVHPLFTPHHHVRSGLVRDPGRMLIIGLDFGLSPAIAVTQYDGGIRVLAELVPQDVSLETLIRDHFIPMMRDQFSRFQYMVVCDPTGANRSSLDKRDSISVVRSYNIPVVAAYSNAVSTRLGAVDEYLLRLDGLQVDDLCETTVEAFSGGYRFPDKSEGHSNPIKNHPFSDIMDSIQYAALYYKYGGGEAESIMTANTRVYMPDNDQAANQFMW